MSQNISSDNNETYWYYTDESNDIRMISDEEYDPDVHIGRNLLTVFPVVVFETGSTGPVVILRTFPIPSGEPIIQ
ncbi:hypothetical protein SK128_015549, partial [Halocaridina rubra]